MTRTPHLTPHHTTRHCIATHHTGRHNTAILIEIRHGWFYRECVFSQFTYVRARLFAKHSLWQFWQAIEDTNIRTTHLYTSPITIHTLTLLADMFYTIYVSGERQRIHHRHDEGCVLPCFMTTLYDYTCAVQTVCVACDAWNQNLSDPKCYACCGQQHHH